MTTQRAVRTGDRVEVNRGGIHIGKGKVTGTETKKNGTWISVNLAGARETPDVRTYRPGNLTRL